jgi:LmbE family N-acetylglucosaminyl deacetylase
LNNDLNPGEVLFMIRILFLAAALAAFLAAPLSSQSQTRLEDLHGKTVLLFTPHPDDDTFCCAGTLALLALNGNNIRIVIYTNDDKGSYDLDMTSERLARIRMHEEEESCRVLGIPKDHISWLEYHDGMLEYANTRDLVEEVTRIIRQVRPEVVLSIDPGSEYVRWHKTDHRMAANNTLDAIRAAEFHLYFPNQELPTRRCRGQRGANLRLLKQLLRPSSRLLRSDYTSTRVRLHIGNRGPRGERRGDGRGPRGAMACLRWSGWQA